MLYLDFETQSDIDLKKSGVYRYVDTHYFKPLCMAWAVDDGPVQLWKDGEPLPEEIGTSTNLVCFNAEFEHTVFHSDYFKFREQDVSNVKYDNIIDVQALAATFGFPQNLEDLAKALAVKHQKDVRGTRLINKLCKVTNGIAVTPEMYPEDFEELYEYCKQDVRTTRECHKYMLRKKLTPFEHAVYIHTMEQNGYGLPIDANTVRKIVDILEAFKKQCNLRLCEITKGEIEKGTQTQKITQFLQPRCNIPNLQAQTVEMYLNSDRLDRLCHEILTIRQKTSRSSTAKFEKIIDRISEKDNRIRGNLKYHGSHTGRFAGAGFQMHNLPRAKHDAPEQVIKDFNAKTLPYLINKYGNIGEAASKLVRPMIKAPKGKVLMVADYKSVENVCLHWGANDPQTTEDFRNGVDQYKRYASRRFNTHYDEVTDKQRTYAKPCVLGLGYGGGAGALQRVASDYGIDLSDERAERDKHFYRNMYPMIPKLWRRVNNAMINAVQKKTITEINTGTMQLRFIKHGTYAFIILPSGRALSYPAPQIQYDSRYGNPCFTYMGLTVGRNWTRHGDQYKDPPDMAVHGGRLVENIIQAIARDLLVYGLLYLRQAGFKIIGSVHDEAIAEVNDENGTRTILDKFCKIMCTLPQWAKGLPLSADGYIAKRYRKE